MPELPEVEVLRLGLQELVIGKKVADIKVLNAKSFQTDTNTIDRFVVGATITGLDRRGKLLIIHLSSNYSLLVHLRMTGQMVFVQEPKMKGNNPSSINLQKQTSRQMSFRGRGTDDEFTSASSEGENPSSIRYGAGHPNDSLVGKLPDKSTRIICTFSDGSKLFFNDQRKFGYWMAVPTTQIEHNSFVSKLGPEPLKPGFTKNVFKNRLQKRSNTNIKAALLDQTVLAGVGNIYADEALYRAKIHPVNPVFKLDANDINILRSAIIDVMSTSIDLGGSSDKNYVNAKGQKGSYMQFAKVFRREGLACERCGSIIEKIRVAGRGTHICPHCQKMM